MKNISLKCYTVYYKSMERSNKLQKRLLMYDTILPLSGKQSVLQRLAMRQFFRYE